MTKALMVLGEDPRELIYGAEGEAELAHRVEWVAPPMTADALAARLEVLREVEVIFTGWGAPTLDEALLAEAPRLRAVFYGAGSIRSTVTEAFWAREIEITSAYAMNAVPVAEFTLATVLLSLKGTWHHMVGTKLAGKRVPMRECAGAYGSKVGLISLGMIGRRVRERLRPFDMAVLAYDPFVTREQAAAMDVEMVDLETLFRQSDVVSLHTPWLKETEGMITGALLGAMKPEATFINTARGAVVRENELIEVMMARPDLTAVLDVTWPEPPVEGSPLYTLPNVILTPHIAGSKDRECRRMGRLMIDEFDRWSRGEGLKWGISREKSARLA